MSQEISTDIVIILIYLVGLVYLSIKIFHSWVRSPKGRFFDPLRLLGCETEEQCRAIQHGSMWVKRLKKWFVMTSLGAFLFAGDLLSATISYIETLEAKSRPNFLWRYSIGWFQDPKRSNQLIEIWKVYDAFESIIFIILILFAARWSYADARCRGGRFPNFYVLAFLMSVINTAIYFGLWYLLEDFMNQLT